MNSEELIKKIFSAIKKKPNSASAYEDLFSFCRGIEENEYKLKFKFSRLFMFIIENTFFSNNGIKRANKHC